MGDNVSYLKKKKSDLFVNYLLIVFFVNFKFSLAIIITMSDIL